MMETYNNTNDLRIDPRIINRIFTGELLKKFYKTLESENVKKAFEEKVEAFQFPRRERKRLLKEMKMILKIELILKGLDSIIQDPDKTLKSCILENLTEKYVLDFIEKSNIVIPL